MDGGELLPAAPAPPAAPESRKRSRRRQVIQVVVSLGIVVAVFIGVLPQVADFSRVWAAVRGMTGTEVATLVIAALWNLTTYWYLQIAALPGLTLQQAAILTLSSTAISNTVPAGSAVGIGVSAAMLRSWQFPRSRVTLALLVSGIWNNLVKLVLPVVALAVLALQGEASAARVIAAAVGIGALVASIALFALMLRNERTAARLGLLAQRVTNAVLRLLRRPPAEGWDIATTRFREKTVGLLRTRWIALTATTLVSHLSLYAVLLLALRHVGISEREVGWAEVLAVFAFVRLVSAIPITPGGLGVVELALTAGLVAADGPRPEVVAAILVYRALTYLLPVPLGVLTYAWWRRTTAHSPAVPSFEGT